MLFQRMVWCLVLFSACLYPLSTWAATSIDQTMAGRVVKHVGHVEVVESPGSESKLVQGSDTKLLSTSVVKTSEGSRAYIKLVDGSKIILRENSLIRLNGFSEIGVDRGKVLFSVAKRSIDVFKVATKIALLGVRGTSFLVDQSNSHDDLAVHLQEGLVRVSSTDKKFEYFKKEQKSEFERFKEQMNSEFDAYKTAHLKEFREYVKEIDMQAGDVLTISNNKARNIEWSAEFDGWFDEFNASFF